jgi:pheromone shutdown protein TraB
MGVGIGISLVASILAGAIAGPFVVPAGIAPGILVGIADTLIVALGMGLVLGTILTVLLGRSAPEEDLDEFDIEQMTDTDVVGAMMEEFRRFSPGGAEALIDERDAYIAHQLVALRDQGKHVVAIVGAGHRDGIERYLETPSLLPPMSELTGRTSGGRFSIYKLFGYLFTLGFLVFFVLLAIATYTGVEGASSGLLFRLFAAWFLVNGILAFGLAKIAGAHWRSAGVGGGVAWLTSVNPLLAPGWFAGYVELRYLDVNVSDISTLNNIMSDEEAPIRELWSDLRGVPLFRLIMIVALTNVGSFVGSVLFATVLLPYLFAESGIEGASGVARLMLEAAHNSIDLLVGAVA